MRKGLVIAAAIVGLLVSCKDKKMSNAFDVEDDLEEDSIEAFVGDTLHLFQEEEPPAAVDELFDDFFYNFIDDSHFQGQRIAYPLPYKEGEDNERLTKEEWTRFDHFKNQEVLAVLYEREQDYALSKDTSMQHVGVEWIGLRNNEVEKFHFNRVNGKWMLTEIDKKKREDIPNGHFLDFYAHFISDSIYQRESLADPIKVILTSDDGEEEPQEEHLTADEWFEMKNSLPLPTHELVNVDYGQACISQNKKTLLLQGISNGMQMKFKFNKEDGGWKLKEIEY
ncbi:MAG: DUF4348 domain-containing protein [Bacteroidaceae bacterium]|nr:DUF4348 domain-containing protein [Bacteroidaceae bacterium]